jgi:hypothetical protein
VKGSENTLGLCFGKRDFVETTVLNLIGFCKAHLEGAFERIEEGLKGIVSFWG